MARNAFWKLTNLALATLFAGCVGAAPDDTSVDLDDGADGLSGQTPNSASTAALALDRPKGIYVVDDGDRDFANALANRNVTGALVRYHWKVGEPSDNAFAFTTLCSKINQALTAGKKVTLANFANAPQWLVDSLPADQVWTHPQFGRQPLPWNTTAQQQMRAYATAQANHVCSGQTLPLKSLTQIMQVDTPILAMQSIRNAPTGYNLATLTSAVRTSVNIWVDAYGATSHRFYVGVFPVGTNATDAITLRDAILTDHPEHNFFQETWTGAGPSGTLASVLQQGTKSFGVMLQACGYWSDQARIRCSFDNTPDADSPLKGHNQVGKVLGAKYQEIYPDDILNAGFQDDLATIAAFDLQ